MHVATFPLVALVVLVVGVFARHACLVLVGAACLVLTVVLLAAARRYATSGGAARNLLVRGYCALQTILKL